MNVLIFTASTGGGHKRAAAAIEAKIHALSPETTVTVIDGMKAIGKFYDRTVCKGYHIMATKTTKFYGKLYRITDKRNPMTKAVMKSNEMMASQLLEVIDEHDPDIIIICHAFITNMVSRLKGKGKIAAKVISLITDYDSHRTYFSPNIDAFVLAEPQMKRKLCEEYGVPAVSIRLAQTFGPGVDYNDKRVFAMMTRNAMDGKDIVLATKGTSRHPYLYTAQAVTAVLTVLLKGEPGETYNAANPSTYCSIFEMGEMVAREVAGGKISVRVDENGDASKYPAPSYLNMDISKISALGWKPEHDLVWMYKRLERSLRAE